MAADLSLRLGWIDDKLVRMTMLATGRRKGWWCEGSAVRSRFLFFFFIHILFLRRLLLLVCHCRRPPRLRRRPPRLRRRSRLRRRFFAKVARTVSLLQSANLPVALPSLDQEGDDAVGEEGGEGKVGKGRRLTQQGFKDTMAVDKKVKLDGSWWSTVKKARRRRRRKQSMFVSLS